MIGVDLLVNPRQAVGLLSGFGDRAGDMRPALGIVRELMVQGHEENFESRGSFLGSSWPPLSDQTVARKARQGLTPEPLIGESGSLLASLSGGKGKVSRVTRTSARAGTSVFYARFHQGGASGKRRGEMPARPLVGMGESEFQAALSVISRYLEFGR